MLARTSARRLARSFATVAEASPGIRVASVDHGSPVCSLTLLTKAGSRYETKPGVALALKNFAFKSTASRSALGTIRETELYGGVLSATLGREHLAVTAEFLRGDEKYFLDLLLSFLSTSRFTRYEFEESVLPTSEAEVLAAAHDPVTTALDTAHALAFRTGLGHSLFGPAHTLEVSDIAHYAHVTLGSAAVLGTGVPHDTLASLVRTALAPPPDDIDAPPPRAAAPPSAHGPSRYFGGSARIAGHGPLQTLFIGLGAASPASAEARVLAAHLSAAPAVKWGQGAAALAGVLPAGARVSAEVLGYSDASVLGVLVQAPTATGVRDAGKAVVQALREAAAGNVGKEAFARATAVARFQAASGLEGREAFVNVLGAQVLAGKEATVESVLAPLEKVTASKFGSTAAALLKSKPTFVAVGDLHSLPYADELGL